MTTTGRACSSRWSGCAAALNRARSARSACEPKRDGAGSTRSCWWWSAITTARPLRLIATLSDSSERHDAQERQRLSASLFQHLHEGLLIADADLRVLDVNPAYMQILGGTREELLGSVPSLLRPAPPDPLVRQQRLLMWSSLRSTGRWRGEVVERRRNGEACTLQATISTVNDADGKCSTTCWSSPTSPSNASSATGSSARPISTN